MSKNLTLTLHRVSHCYFSVIFTTSIFDTLSYIMRRMGEKYVNQNTKTIKFTASNGIEVELVFKNENCDKTLENVKDSILALYEKRIRRDKK